MIDMRVDLAGMRLPNPLMPASGCAANGKELHRFFDIAELGAFVTKTVLADPRSPGHRCKHRQAAYSRLTHTCSMTEEVM